MTKTHFEGPVVSERGFYGDLYGKVHGSKPVESLAKETLTTSGPITIQNGLVILDKVTPMTATLENPTAGVDDGKMLVIVSITAAPHTISNASGAGFNGSGKSSGLAKLGGAIGDGLTVIAYQGKWYVISRINATLT